MDDPRQIEIRCARCAREGVAPMGAPPFPTDLGRRIAAEVCAECWEAWKRRQMLLINHYGLDLQDPRAREFLLANLRAFLFGEGGPASGDSPASGPLPSDESPSGAGESTES